MSDWLFGLVSGIQITTLAWLAWALTRAYLQDRREDAEWWASPAGKRMLAAEELSNEQ